MQSTKPHSAQIALALAIVAATMLAQAEPGTSDITVVATPTGGGGRSESSRFELSGYVPIVAQTVAHSARFAIRPHRPTQPGVSDLIYFDSFEQGS